MTKLFNCSVNWIRSGFVVFLMMTLVFVGQGANALNTGYAPEHYENKLVYGIGLYFAPHELTIYESPDDTQEPIDRLKWGSNQRPEVIYSERQDKIISAHSFFITFFPELEVAALAVVSENGEGWAEIVYDQSSNKIGWVKMRSLIDEEKIVSWPKHWGQFQTWLDFIKFNGKAAGIYWLVGVPAYYRSLRTSPDDKAKLIDVQVIRKLKIRHIRGNWLLVEIMDFDRSTPIGWVRWRDKNGRLMLFPNLAGKKTQQVMGF